MANLRMKFGGGGLMKTFSDRGTPRQLRRAIEKEQKKQLNNKDYAKKS